MPTKPKYDYDINIIEKSENDGMSIRAVARKNGWPEENTQQWIHRNYIKVIKYIKRVSI